jgi:mannose-P-dolichol utilization defect protein 1
MMTLVVLAFIIAGAYWNPKIGQSPEDETEDLGFKLLFFREDWFDEFLKFNIFYKDCIAITLSKGLGYGIILGAGMVKIPQIYNIVKAKSGRGILPSMFYMECFMFIINGCYNIHLSSPFSVYGENFCLLLQNFVIIALLWTYEKKTSKHMKMAISCSIFGTIGYLYFDVMVPSFLWKVFMDIQILMVVYSRMPQIIENYRHKFTGELSSVMFLANACGNIARTYTFIKETQDLYNMFTSGLSAALNLIIFLQVIVYWKNSKQYLNAEELKDIENDPSKVEGNASPNDKTLDICGIPSRSDGRPSL